MIKRKYLDLTTQTTYIKFSVVCGFLPLPFEYISCTCMYAYRYMSVSKQEGNIFMKNPYTFVCTVYILVVLVWKICKTCGKVGLWYWRMLNHTDIILLVRTSKDAQNNTCRFWDFLDCMHTCTFIFHLNLHYAMDQ